MVKPERFAMLDMDDAPDAPPHKPHVEPLAIDFDDEPGEYVPAVIFGPTLVRRVAPSFEMGDYVQMGTGGGTGTVVPALTADYPGHVWVEPDGKWHEPWCYLPENLTLVRKAFRS